MAPLALEQAAEDLANHPGPGSGTGKSSRSKYYTCQAKVGIAAFASGFIGFSGGFALQTLSKRALPRVLTRNFFIPCLLGALVSSRTYHYLHLSCTENHLSHKELVLKKDNEQKTDHQVALS